MLEQLYQNKDQILVKAQNYFSKNSNSLTIKIGCELEFFLLQKNGAAVFDQELVTSLIRELNDELVKNFSLIYLLEKEQGVSQLEVKTVFTDDLILLAEQIFAAKNYIKNFAATKNLQASFAAQPFADDCGNALQFNISLHYLADKNLFESDQKLLKNVAASLLTKTNDMMIFLAPKPQDYARFSFSTNRQLFKKGKFTAPVNLSFGADNRSCAIRIPHSKIGKRLEYRVAAAGADFYLVAAAILLAVCDGINGEFLGFEQIHGNAFDVQYEAKNFCQNLEEAENFFAREDNFFRCFVEE